MFRRRPKHHEYDRGLITCAKCDLTAETKRPFKIGLTPVPEPSVNVESRIVAIGEIARISGVIRSIFLTSIEGGCLALGLGGDLLLTMFAFALPLPLGVGFHLRRFS